MGLQHLKCGFYQRCFDNRNFFEKIFFLRTIFLFLPKSYVGDSAGFKTFKNPVLTIRYISLTSLCAFGK